MIEMSEQNDTIESNDYIEVIGARANNLKDISLRIPRNQLVVITGISGSGKSSLAFDTIYAEGQRRYMETFTSYARQFIGEMERPDVEKITGLSPVISIEQKTTSRSPRSTVGTITEIYDFLRLLFARIGDAYSYETGKKMVKYTEEQMLEHIKTSFYHRKMVVLAPLVRARKGHYRELFEYTRKQGYTKVRVNGEMIDLVPRLQVDRYKTHDIEAVIDRITVSEDKIDRLRSSVQIALKLGKGFIMLMDYETKEITSYSKFLMDPESSISYEEPSPNAFSFNSPYGYCQKCRGLGVLTEVDLKAVIPDDTKSINDQGIAPFGEVRSNMTFTQLRAISKKYKFTFATPIKNIPKEALDIILYGSDEKFDFKIQYGNDEHSYNLAAEGIVKMLQRWYDNSSSDKIRQWAEDYMTVVTCDSCAGHRLRRESLHFKINEKHIGELSILDIATLSDWMQNVEATLTDRNKLIAKDILKEIKLRLGFLLNVGLDYLTLHRPAGTLSGGEAQRIRLATQIGSQLTGITYILDEPSIGLHQRDNQRLIDALRHLAAIGNSVLVVEHDKDIMLASDYLIDLGPGAGKHGGDLVAAGKPIIFKNERTITAEYLNNVRRIEIPKERRKGNGNFLALKGATGNNLKEVDLKLPLGTFICVTGVSGSGKSTLINETLYPILRQHFYRSKKNPLAFKSFTGFEHIDKVIEIDQSPIGRTPRSNPATYTDVFGSIRTLFSDLPEAKIRGYKPGRFSFNVKGGRCEECQGGGMRVIEMNFLPDVLVQCETCFGRRYNRETLEILYKGKSISDVLDMTVSEATAFFENIPKIYRKVKTLNDVGLGYITLGQSAITLSGGEAQRVKLAEELSKRDTGKTIYILDEPTTGLHFEDIRILLNVLYKLVERGNTILVIEHSMDVIKVADYIIDVGPEGGHRGGKIVCEGTPEEIIKNEESYTAQFLKLEL
jgi:excinuclease ABC subunit A